MASVSGPRGRAGISSAGSSCDRRGRLARATVCVTIASGGGPVGKALIITEKPSVARDIVAALGGFVPRDGNAYWESDAYVVSFAVGHLLTLLEPEDIDPGYRAW